tara:strand:+ start:1022 stop:1162 length:141 start_codon:yes stop_codon:yes gene_type:complete
MNTKNVSEVKEQDEVSKELFKKSDAEKKELKMAKKAYKLKQKMKYG